MLRDLKYFFLISRPANVAISLLAFGVACLFVNDYTFIFLTHSKFWYTAATIVVIAATGYWINDVYDFRIDRINKPRKTVVNAILSVKKVLTVYFVANFLILAFSTFFLGYQNQEVAITFINFLSVVLLFVYASYLKRVSVGGNLVISFLIALVLILAYYLYDRINMPLIWAIVFAFEITFIREITKDVQDIKGDLKYKLHTLPIALGVKHTKSVLLILYIIFLISCYLPFAFGYFMEGEILWPYLLSTVILVQIPTFYLVYLLGKAKEPDDFKSQSNYLKLLMLTGIITLFFI
jgi:4-hydroxybenzoate polyprenyltransferase